MPAQNGLDILHSQSKVEILKINSSDNEEKCMSILQKADAYQVGAARDEVPKYLQVDKQFLTKIPNLLVVHLLVQATTLLMLMHVLRCRCISS